MIMGFPSVYPTGTTIFYPEECWNGFTLFQAKDTGAAIIDMNGQVKQLWQGLQGYPNALLPGGHVMGSTGERSTKFGYQDHLDVVEVDWDGRIIWKFDHYAYIEDPGERPQWMARQHHDFQREGCPVGYYVPGMEPMINGGNTFLLCHKNLTNPKISERPLLDDTFIEVDWEGNILWEWICSDHFDEFEFSERARHTLALNPNFHKIGKGFGDWMHINAMSLVGPNSFYEAGDQRFHPDNIIWSGRQTNIIAITEKKSGKIVWKLGPEYDATQESRKIGWIIGPHHAHIIPKGLPGQGNLLVFDNGGWAGYGAPNPGSPDGFNNALRDYSRVLEIDPISFDIVWQYTPVEAGCVPPVTFYKFYSPFISSVQRLPNGNTLITLGSDGIIIEVTPGHDIVWEYVSPFSAKGRKLSMVYRAYRVPYEWIPQLEIPEEIPIEKIEANTYSLAGIAPKKANRVIQMEGVKPYETGSPLCVLPEYRKIEGD
jgi:hypothetical protein